MNQGSKVRLCSMAPALREMPYPTNLYRVTLPDGTTLEERAIGLSQIAAHYPQAVRVEVVVAVGDFW